MVWDDWDPVQCCDPMSEGIRDGDIEIVRDRLSLMARLAKRGVPGDGYCPWCGRRVRWIQREVEE